MKHALISDIHANLPALRAVLDEIAGRTDVSATFHLGDLVGYGPWPNETVALLRERGVAGIAGNYDSTVAAGYKHCGCRADSPREEELAHISYEWTRAQVTEETRRYLAALPFSLNVRPLGGHVAGPALVLLHGNQSLNTVYVTQDRDDSFLRKMATASGASAGDIVCFGHTHKPWHRVVDGISFVNTGSVGRPKDGDPRACYALLDISANTTAVEFVRVEYDVDESIRGIAAAGLPAEFGDILRTGGHLRGGLGALT